MACCTVTFNFFTLLYADDKIVVTKYQDKLQKVINKWNDMVETQTENVLSRI
jgi:hypothetical protein